MKKLIIIIVVVVVGMCTGNAQNDPTNDDWSTGALGTSTSSNVSNWSYIATYNTKCWWTN